jgi:C1A family cysteine protease
MKQHCGTIWLSVAAFLVFPSILSGQQEYKGGLIAEDLSKIPWIHRYEVLKKTSDLPLSVDLSQHLPPVGTQYLNSCTCWALAYYMKSYQEWQERGWDLSLPAHAFSPTFVYNQINSGRDSGSAMSAAARVLMESGCATLTDLPEPSRDFQSLPTESAFSNALPFRCSAAYSGDCSSTLGVQQIKGILAEGKLVAVAIWMYPNLFQIQNYGNVYCVANKSGVRSTIGHVITLVGYDDQKQTNDGAGAFRFVNSWGTSWGDKGLGWISYKAITDGDLSQRVFMFLTDRIGYTPTFRAKVGIDHPSRGTISLQLGIGSVAAPIWTRTIYFPTMSYIRLPISGTFVFDLTDGMQSLPQGQATDLFVICRDNSADKLAGTLGSFSYQDVESQVVLPSTQTPRVIPDSGQTAASLVISRGQAQLRTALVSPQNGQTLMPLNTTLSWNPSPAASTYQVQLSSSDLDFSKRIYFQQSNVTAMSLTLFGLDRSTVYYWRVKPTDASETEWSDTWSFETTSSSPRIGYTASKSTYNWIDISTSGIPISRWENNGIFSDTLMSVLDDGYTPNAIPIGFQFNFFGKVYDGMYVGINGLISFTEKKLNSSYGSSAQGLGYCSSSFFPPTGALPSSIAVAYSDYNLDPTGGKGGGRVVYTTVGTKFILSWESVVAFSYPADPPNSFQLILDGSTQSSTIQFKKICNDQIRAGLHAGIQKDDTVSLFWSQSPADQSAITFVPALIPSTPQLKSPAEKALCTVFSPTLIWTPVSGASHYIVHIAEHPDFSSICCADSTPGESYQPGKPLQGGMTYFWRVCAYGPGGMSEWSSVRSFATTDKQQTDVLPTEFALFTNFPNPFNARTVVRFALPEACSVKMEIFNVLGQNVALLVDQELRAGYYQYDWTSQSASGIYFCRLDARGVAYPNSRFIRILKMLLTK